MYWGWQNQILYEIKQFLLFQAFQCSLSLQKLPSLNYSDVKVVTFLTATQNSSLTIQYLNKALFKSNLNSQYCSTIWQVVFTMYMNKINMIKLKL